MYRSITLCCLNNYGKKDFKTVDMKKLEERNLQIFQLIHKPEFDGHLLTDTTITFSDRDKYVQLILFLQSEGIELN